MRIDRYTPMFVEGASPESGDFDDLDGLKNIPFVTKWLNSVDFHQFSMCDNQLLAEFKGGLSWYVVGRCSDVPNWLPKWDKGAYLVWIDDEVVRIQGRDVASTCGDVVTLHDGRNLTRHSV